MPMERLGPVVRPPRRTFAEARRMADISESLYTSKVAAHASVRDARVQRPRTKAWIAAASRGFEA